MARRKRRRTKKVRLAEEVSLAVGGVHRAVEDEIIKAMHIISKEIESTFRAELRHAGIKRSSDTGSIDRASAKKQASNQRYGSVHDIQARVEQGKGNRVIAKANNPDGNFKLNFFNDPKAEDHQLWGKSSSHMNLNELAGTTGQNIDKKIMKQVEPVAKQLIDKAIQKGLRAGSDSKTKEL